MTWPIPGGAGGVGPTGPAGADGAPGAVGATGPTGPAGPSTYAAVQTALADAAGDTTAIAGPVDAQGDDIKAVTTTVLRILNATAADAVNTIQKPGSLVWEGHVRVSGADRTIKARITLTPTTTGATGIAVEYDLGAGAGYTTAFSWTSSTASQFVAAFSSYYFTAGTGGGYMFDTNFSGLFLGGSGDLQFLARSTTLSALLRSHVSPGSTPAFRTYAFGGDFTAAQVVEEWGDKVASAFVRLAALMGDGVFEAPDLHTDATVKTADFTAVLKTQHFWDASGSSITVTVPAASAANAGWRIELHQTVAGVADLVLTPASGTIEGAASITIPGLALAPLRSIVLRSCGVGTGSPGWKVSRTT